MCVRVYSIVSLYKNHSLSFLRVNITESWRDVISEVSNILANIGIRNLCVSYSHWTLSVIIKHAEK